VEAGKTRDVLNLLRPRRLTDWIALALLVALIVGGAISAVFLSRYAVIVHRLTRGIGDTVFYGADGQPWFRLDEQRHDVALREISIDLQHAVVAVEDRRFYRHPGIDPIGLARAVVRDVQQGSRAEGASTLTQQLARTLFLSNVKSYGRKLREAGIALLIEAQLTKPQILEFYLNRVYLSAGVYGVQTMSEHLFRKPASAVTLPEAALIAGLIRAPSALSPWSNYDGALERSHLVLATMRDQGFITAAQEAEARAVRPRIQPYRQPSDGRAGWAKDYLRQQFRAEFGGDNPPDWQVHTAFLPKVQDAAERAVAMGLDRMRRPGLEAALVAIDPQTGDILAMVGGANYPRSTFNRATRSKRQPGSAFKPLVYTAALEHGYSPVSLLSNLQHVTAPDNPEWMPRSAHGEQPDAMTLRCRTCRRWRSAPGSSPRSNSPPSTRCSPAPARSPSRAGSSACSMRAVRRSSTGPLNAPRSSPRRSHSRWSACCATSSSGALVPPHARSGSAEPSAERPEPPTIITMRGSSGFLPRSSQVSGSDSISRRRLRARPTARESPCRSGRTS